MDDTTRAPALPPAREGSMAVDEAIRQLRQSVAGFAHYDDDAPQLSTNILRSRVVLREIDRLKAEHDQALAESTRLAIKNERLRALLAEHQWAATVIVGDDFLEVCPDCLMTEARGHQPTCRFAAALAPRPAAPAAEGGGA